MLIFAELHGNSFVELSLRGSAANEAVGPFAYPLSLSFSFSKNSKRTLYSASS